MEELNGTFENDNADFPVVSLDTMIAELNQLAGVEIESLESPYRSFVRNAQLAVTNTEFLDRLTDLQAELTEQHVVGLIRSLEAWADGTVGLRIVWKSWPSLIDKLYRVNKVENPDFDQPPVARTVHELADRAPLGSARRWITPAISHLYVDDILRTKFVVPFADGVVELSAQITGIATALGLKWYRRYHAKDSGYHAHHVYILLGRPTLVEMTQKLSSRSRF